SAQASTRLRAVAPPPRPPRPPPCRPCGGVPPCCTAACPCAPCFAPVPATRSPKLIAPANTKEIATMPSLLFMTAPAGWRRISRPGLRSLNSPRDDFVRRRAAEEPAATRRYGDVLLAVLAHVGRRNRVRGRFELLAPEHLTVARIDRAEHAVH